MSNNTVSVPPLIPSGDTLQAQAAGFTRDSALWIRSHWLEILIASGIAVGIVLLVVVMAINITQLTLSGTFRKEHVR